MKDLLIGTLTGVTAVLATAWLNPAPAPPPILREALPAYPARADESASLPTTQPDSAQVQLEKMIKSVTVENGRLDKVLDFIANSTGANMVVNWRALEAAGIGADAPVTLNLHQIPARVLLNQTLAVVGGGNIKLSYHIADGIVTVSTADDLAHDMVTRVYDVSDLLDQSLAKSRKYTPPTSQPMTLPEATDELVKTIGEVVAPKGWDAQTGRIYALAGKLVVIDTFESHDKIRQVLAALRQKSK
jgi:hypothetical protein